MDKEIVKYLFILGIYWLMFVGLLSCIRRKIDIGYPLYFKATGKKAVILGGILFLVGAYPTINGLIYNIHNPLKLIVLILLMVLGLILAHLSSKSKFFKNKLTFPK